MKGRGKGKMRKEREEDERGGKRRRGSEGRGRERSRWHLHSNALYIVYSCLAVIGDLFNSCDKILHKGNLSKEGFHLSHCLGEQSFMAEK